MNSRASTAADPESDIGVAVVARWYPSIHDPISGRFVADHVQGIRDVEGIAPHVVTFDPAPLSGAVNERQRQFDAVRKLTAGARSGVDPFHEQGWRSPAGVPITRLTIPTGWVAAKDEPDHQAADRTDALLAVADPLSRRLPRRSLVHAHTAYPDGNAAAHLATRLGLPLVITEHSTFLGQQLADPPRRAGVLAAMDAAARVMTVSETLAREIRTSIPAIAEKLLVVPNVVAINDFKLIDPAARTPDEILFVGYLREIKGIDLLLDAFARVRAVRPAARLRLVGRAPTSADDRRWADQVEALGLRDVVSFDGPADRAGVVAAMSRAALLVHAGYRETFGVVAVEALASGLPVVATDSGGITEILGDEPDRYGRLVRSRDADALAAAILDALANRDRFDPATLRAHVQDRFDAPSVARRIVDVYQEVLVEWDRTPREGRRRAGAGSRERLPSARLPSNGRALVVTLKGQRAVDLLAPLPDGLLRRMTAITGTAVVAEDLRRIGISDVKVLDPLDVYREELERVGAVGVRGSLLDRLRRFVRNPLGPWERRRVRSRRKAILSGTLEYSLAAAARAARSRGEPVLVVCLDGADYAVVRSLQGKPALRLAPGGVRWLADGVSDGRD